MSFRLGWIFYVFKSHHKYTMFKIILLEILSKISYVIWRDFLMRTVGLREEKVKMFVGRKKELFDFTVAQMDVGLGFELRWLKGKRFRENEFSSLYVESVKDRVVLDIGSNVGYFGVLAILNGSKEIVLIEPRRDIISILEENIMNAIEIRKNSLPYKIINKVIADEDKPVLFEYRKEFNKSRITNKRGSQHFSSSLDSLLIKEPVLNRVDLIRMDVEGGEYYVIKGGSKFFKSRKKGTLIFMEVHPFYMSKQEILEMFNLLHSYGYKIKKYIFNPYFRHYFPVNVSSLLSKCVSEITRGIDKIELSPLFLNGYPLATHIVFEKVK